mgnify:FL=1
MSNEIFIILSSNQISVDVFDKEKEKSIHNKIYKIENNLSDNIKLEDNLNGVLKEQIINIEKKINYTVNKINLILCDPNNLKIEISTKKSYDLKQIQKDQIQYLIQDLKQQILTSNKDLKILHIIIENYIIDGNKIYEIPLQMNCKNLIIEAKFICVKKNLADFFYRIFKNYQIKLNSVICGNYALSLNEIDKSNPLEGGLKVLNGENLKEVYILPKKPAKLGFFEKMFHLFS